MKKIRIITVLIVSLFISKLSIAQQADLDILFNRLYSQYSTGFSDNSTIANVITWYNNQNADGTWTDIANAAAGSNYATIVGGYCPNDHLIRTNAMIFAYISNSISGNPYYHNANMLAKIKLALNQNLSHVQATVFSNSGFYQAYINAIPAYTKGLILIKNFLTTSEYQTYCTHMKDILQIKGIRITGYGLNFIGEANSTVCQGIAAGNYSLIQEGIDTIAGDMRIKSIDSYVNDSLGEGIKADYSWHEHGVQLYSGGYGLQALNFYTSLILLTKGTSIGTAFTPDKIQLFSNFVLEGHRWLSYRGISDLASCGRNISRVSGVHDIYPQQISPIIQIDPANTAAYNTWINHVKNGGPSGLTGNKHFWKSDVMVQRGANYYMSVKIPSIRRVSTEYMNNENLKYKNLLPLGYTQIYTSGNEYNGIFPLWDWSRIPGMTGEKTEIVTIAGPNDSPLGPNSYAGGVSSNGGTMGFMAYKATINGISANKSYFFIGDAMFCLGSGITGNKANGIVTSVNQAFPNGTITVNNGTTQTFTTGTPNYSNIAWIHNDNIGYIFPNGGSVSVQNVQQSSSTGTWKNIGTYTNAISPANVFSIWINHGTAPNNATYQYIVVPDKNLAAFQTFAANPGFVVVQNDGNIQAIRNTNYNVDAIVFYQAGTINMGDGQTVTVDKPSLVLIEKDTTGYNVTVSDPNYNAANTTLTVTINNQATIFNLPTGNYLGSSVSKFVAFTNQWKNQPLSIPVTDIKKISYTVTPQANLLDLVTGLSQNQANAYDSVACSVRFNNTGFIDVLDSNVYKADALVSYTANTSYLVEIIADVTNHTYSCWITPQGGTKIQIANNYTFRAAQLACTQLLNLASYSTSAYTISNIQEFCVTQPYIAMTLPGTIAIQNFDRGGQGCAYYDADVANNGGAARTTESVDIEKSATEGYDVGWVAAGEWIDYTVTVSKTGQYDVFLRLAAIVAGKTLHFNVDGKQATPSIEAPITGNWQKFQNTYSTLALTSGVHTIQVYFETSGFNISKLEFMLSPYVQINGNTSIQSDSARLCEGGTVTFSTQTAPGTWAWSGPNTFTATGNIIKLSNITPSQSGNYVVTFTNVSGTSFTQTCTLTVLSNPVITPYIRINTAAWQNTATATLTENDMVSFGPQPIVTNLWSWKGPQNFSSAIRTPVISNITMPQSGNYIVNYIDSNGCSSSQTFQISVMKKQSIGLNAGWNLISTNVYPTDSSIATLFAGLDVQEIKTMNSFWRKGQNTAFNSLKALTSGQGYLIYMNAAGTLSLSGFQNLQGLPPIKSGWNLIGCPYQTATALSSIFTSTNTNIVKDFDGYWIPNGTTNSITTLNPGTGYFVKSK